MMRWMRPAELAGADAAVGFDAVAEGTRHGLVPEVSHAIWERARADATESDGRWEQAQAARRFHEIAARVAARGGTLRPDAGRSSREPGPHAPAWRVGPRLEVGRITRYDYERAAPDAWDDALAAPVPGRDTRVAAEARAAEARHGVALADGPSVARREATPRPADEGDTGAVSRRGAAFLSGTSAVLASRHSATAAGEGDRHLATRRAGAFHLSAGALLASRDAASSAAVAQQRARDEDWELRVHAALAQDGGMPLSADLRARVEAVFGRDLSHVRLHTDAAAAEAARLLGARALTVGHHVYFAAGGFRPGTREGDQLLIHELTHVVQHARGALAGATDDAGLVRADDAVEREATAMERRASELADPGPATGMRSAGQPPAALADASASTRRARLGGSTSPARSIARKAGPPDLSTQTLLSTLLGRLDALVGHAPVLEILRRQVLRDRDSPPPETGELRRHAERLSDVLVAAEPALTSLATLKQPELYVPGVAVRISDRATFIEGQYAAAVTVAYSDVDPQNTQKAQADKAFGEFADYVVDETLGPDGIVREISQIMPLREEVVAARGRTGRAVLTRPADTMAGFAEPRHFGGLDAVLRRVLDNVRRSRRAGQDVGTQLRQLIEDTRSISALISALAAYEQFIYWSNELEDSVMGRGRPRALAHQYRDELDGILRAFESAQRQPPEQYYAQIQAAAASFDALIARKELKDAVQAIQDRLGTIATVHLIEKVIVITAAAAVTGGIAGEAVAGMTELGAAAGVAGFGAEVVAFTAVSRAGGSALGIPSENSAGKDLAINAITLGVLKGVNLVFARMFALGANASSFAKLGYRLGNLGVSATTLQILAEAQHEYEHDGQSMSGDDHARTALQNIVTIAALELGHFIVRAPGARGLGSLEAQLGKQLRALDAPRAEIATQLDALEARKIAPEQVDVLLGKIQSLYSRELQLLDAAAKRGVAEPVLRKAIAGYQAQIAAVELRLARAGVAGPKAGPQLFQQVRAGVVGFTAAGRPVIEKFYRDQGGTLGAGDKPGELVGTLPSGEKTYFLPDELVKEEQRTREQERKLEDRRKRALDRIAEAVGTDAAHHFESLPVERLEQLAQRPRATLGKLRLVAPDDLGKLLALSPPALDQLLGLEPAQLGTASKLPPDQLAKLCAVEGQGFANLARRPLSELQRVLALDPAGIRVLAGLKFGHVTELLGIAPSAEHLHACARLCDGFMRSGMTEKATVGRVVEMAEDRARLVLVAETFRTADLANERVIHGERVESHEVAQAIDFIRMKGGGGRFEFGPRGLKGVEGDYIPDGAKQRIQVSMKVFTTSDAQNVLQRADANAADIDVSRGPVELLTYTNASAARVYELARTPPPGEAAQRVFRRMTFVCRDGTLVFDSGRWQPPR